MHKLRLTVVGLMAGFLFGCASKTDETGARGKAARYDESDYVRVDSGLSSRIPRRIKISDLSPATLAGSAPTARATGDGVREILTGSIISGGPGGEP